MSKVDPKPGWWLPLVPQTLGAADFRVACLEAVCASLAMQAAQERTQAERETLRSPRRGRPQKEERP